MNKKRFVFAVMAAALALGACTRTQELDGFDQQEPEAQEAVGFDIYTRSSIETKAGYVGDIDLTAMKVTGFGVYGYVTSGTNWSSGGASAKPDFMANQHVTFNGSSWVYSPVKYWPNQSNGVDGGVDNGTATSQGAIDCVSFFAYAPFVEHSALPFGNAADAGTEAAKVSPSADGILYVNASNETDSPKVVYRVAADPSNGVDLMYGVANRAYTAAMTTGGVDPGVVLGMPFTNMTKLTTGDKMEYNFKHALTKLSVKVDGYYDQVNTGAAGTNDVDPNTRIVIESVNLKTARLATWGTLDLNNTIPSTPNWAAAAAGATLSGFNSNAGYELPIASNLKYVDGNEANVTHFSQQPLGVTKTPQSLMGYGVDGTTPASLMFVPNTDGTDGMTVTVTYKVITRDPNLKTGYSSVQNKITHEIASLGGNAFKPGYATTLNLHLGMTTVKMSAEVAGWDEASPEGSTDVPVNVCSHLTFSSASSFTLSVTGGAMVWDGTIEYSTDLSTWTEWNGSGNIDSASGPGLGFVLYLRGKDNHYLTNGTSYGKPWKLSGTGIDCNGNIMTLLDYMDPYHATMDDYCFDAMFNGCASLTTAPALPATTLADGCYEGMFSGCTSLTTAPALPATTLASGCYSSMFLGCTSLTTAPALPATTLASGCYSSMFSDCTSLTTAPALPATTLASGCYSSMFSDCTSLTTAPALPVTTLADGCYAGMFLGCTSLTTAPALPATTLADACYGGMFLGCTSLTTAPALPATTLADMCYMSMFSGCTSLKLSATRDEENGYTVAYQEIPVTDSSCVTDMFSGTSGTFNGTPSSGTMYYLHNSNSVVPAS